MKIVIIYDNIELMGGIQTLIIKMSEYLDKNGHHVQILLSKYKLPKIGIDKNNYIELNKFANIAYLPKFWFLVNARKYACFIKDADYIYCLSQDAVIKGIVLSKYNKNKKILIGIYHPIDYFPRIHKGKLQNFFLKNILKRFPIQNIFSMNIECLESHKDLINGDFKNANIFPLPIKINDEFPIKSKFEKKKIVSIGRLVPFKTYYMSMIQVMVRLKELNIPLEYHVYGDGELYSCIKESIDLYGINEKYFLHGTIPYTKFYETLKDAFLFLGMGTSLIEAASTGTPSIVAICDDKDALTYGCLYNLPGYSVGENIKDLAKIKLIDQIIDIYKCSDQEYLQISKKCYEHASKFDIKKIMPNFLQSLENTESTNLSITFIEKMKEIINRIA